MSTSNSLCEQTVCVSLPGGSLCDSNGHCSLHVSESRLNPITVSSKTSAPTADAVSAELANNTKRYNRVKKQPQTLTQSVGANEKTSSIAASVDALAASVPTKRALKLLTRTYEKSLASQSRTLEASQSTPETLTCSTDHTLLDKQCALAGNLEAVAVQEPEQDNSNIAIVETINSTNDSVHASGEQQSCASSKQENFGQQEACEAAAEQECAQQFAQESEQECEQECAQKSEQECEQECNQVEPKEDSNIDEEQTSVDQHKVTEKPEIIDALETCSEQQMDFGNQEINVEQENAPKIQELEEQNLDEQKVSVQLQKTSSLASVESVLEQSSERSFSNADNTVSMETAAATASDLEQASAEPVEKEPKDASETRQVQADEKGVGEAEADEVEAEKTSAGEVEPDKMEANEAEPDKMDEGEANSDEPIHQSCDQSLCDAYASFAEQAAIEQSQSTNELWQEKDASDVSSSLLEQAAIEQSFAESEADDNCCCSTNQICSSQQSAGNATTCSVDCSEEKSNPPPPQPPARFFYKKPYAFITDVDSETPLIYKVQVRDSKSALLYPLKIVGFKNESIDYNEQSAPVKRKLKGLQLKQIDDGPCIVATVNPNDEKISIKSEKDSLQLPGTVHFATSAAQIGSALQFIRGDGAQNQWSFKWTI